MSDAEEAIEPEGEVRPVSPGMARLNAQIKKLSNLISSGQLDSELRKLILANPVQHGGVTLTAAEAHILEKLTALARAVPFFKLRPSEVAALPRLERAGFVARHGAVVRVTARGRSLGATHARRHDVSRFELESFRRWASELETRGM